MGDTSSRRRMGAARMTRETLLALADRVEKLSGPCRETDAAIWNACEAWLTSDHLCPHFTRSIDAAMTLVPEGSWDHMEVYRPDFQTLGWTVHLLANGNFNEAKPSEGFGQSWPLALTAAALRPRAERLS